MTTAEGAEDLVLHAPIPAWIAPSSLEYFTPNAALAGLLGVNPGVALGKSEWATLISPRERERVLERRQSRGGQGWEVRYTIVLRSGGLDITETARPFRNADESSGWVGWLSRIAGVSAERDRLAAIIEASADAIFTATQEGDIASWNPSAAGLFGYDGSEALGQPVAILAAPGHRVALDQVVATAQDGLAALPVETVCQRKDGLHIEVSMAAAAFATGDEEGIVLVARDISSQKRAARDLETAHDVVQRQVVDLNQQLRQRLADLETLLEVVPVGIGIANDPGCEDIRVNPALARLLRISTGTNASKSASSGSALPFRVWRDGDEVPPEALPMQVAAATGEVLHDELYTLRFTDGSSLDLLEFAAPLRDESGEPRGAVGVFIDVTDRQAAEDALRRASAIKDEFLALVSHELRTPMAVVLGLSRLLYRRIDQLDRQSRDEALEQIQKDAQRLASLIENMLLLARLDHDSTPEFEPLLLSRLLERILADHGARFAQRPLSLDLPGGVHPVVEANETWVEQVLLNLLNNAEKYAPEGTPISVTVEQDPGTSNIVVAVANVAHEMAGSDLEQLFEPFVRSAETSNKPGLGVGLTVCRRLVDAMGGSIGADVDGDRLVVRFTLRAVAPAGE